MTQRVSQQKTKLNKNMDPECTGALDRKKKVCLEIFWVYR